MIWLRCSDVDRSRGTEVQSWICNVPLEEISASHPVYALQICCRLHYSILKPLSHITIQTSSQRILHVVPLWRTQCCYWWPNGHFSCVHHNRDSQCFLMGRTTPNNCPFPWWISTSSNTWRLGPTQVSSPNHIRISSAVFCMAQERDQQTDRQTDRPHNSYL